MLVAAAQIPVEPGFANPAQAAEPRLAGLVKTDEHHISMALIPALINAPGLDAVVQNFLVNAPASEISHHRPVVRGGRRQEQVLGFSSLVTGVRADVGIAALPTTASIASRKEQPLTLMR